MEIIYTARAKEDLAYWQKKSAKKVVRIKALLADMSNNPYTGLGKPEPLKFDKSGYWSRRIDHEHRLIYKLHGNCIYIAQCRYHYKR